MHRSEDCKRSEGQVEAGEVYRPSDAEAADHKIWVKETIALLTSLAANHIRMRDPLLSRIP